jgi:hypothetical protein
VISFDQFIVPIAKSEPCLFSHAMVVRGCVPSAVLLARE